MTYVPNAAFDSVNNRINVAENDPLSQHYVPDEIANVTGGTSDDYYISAETYTGGMLDFILASTPTVKIYMSCEDVAAGADVGTYFDRTADLAAGATITTSEQVSLDPAVVAGATWIKIEVTNSGDWQILANRLWR